MQRVLEIEGLDVTNSEGAIPVDAMDRAIGNVSGWNMLFDPEYIDPNALYTLNRASGSKMESRVVGEIPEVANGFLELLPAAGSFYQYSNDTPIAPNEWSFWWVVKPAGAEGAARQYLVISDPESSQAPSLSIALIAGSGALVVYDTAANAPGQQIRLQYNGNYSNRNEPCFIMVTFSTESGLKIFDNGRLVASAPDDKRPLLSGMDVEGALYLRTAQGSFGLCGQHNVDLGAPEYGADKIALTSFLSQKYGIS